MYSDTIYSVTKLLAVQVSVIAESDGPLRPFFPRSFQRGQFLWQLHFSSAVENNTLGKMIQKFWFRIDIKRKKRGRGYLSCYLYTQTHEGEPAHYTASL